MALIVNDKVYRNLQEQVFENTKDIEELQKTTSKVNILIENVAKLQDDVGPLERKTRHITDTNELKFEVNAPIYTQEVNLRQPNSTDNVVKLRASANGANFGIIDGPLAEFTTNGLYVELPGDSRRLTCDLSSSLSKTFVGNQTSNCSLSIGEDLGSTGYDIVASIKTETSDSYLTLSPLSITGSVSVKDSQGNTTSSSRLQLLTDDLKFYNTNNGEPTTWSVKEQIELNKQIRTLLNNLNGNK